MNIPEKTRLFLPLSVFLWVCSVVSVFGQNWQERYLLNQNNTLQEVRTVLFNANTILSPDPSIGSLSLTTNGSQLTILFDPVDGAEGIAEFIVEYFPNQFPPAPKVEAFRVHVSSSYVITLKDFFSVPENSTGNLLDVIANDTARGSTQLTVSNIAAVTNGIAEIVDAGQAIDFTPHAGFTGMAYITYVVCDELGACAKGDVNICVQPNGDIPESDTIYLSTHSRAPVVAITPLDGFSVSAYPLNGTVASLGDDTWEYKPFSTFDGSDEFTLIKEEYTRHVIVDVYYKAAPNTFANADRVFTRTNEAITFDVLANDIRQYPVDEFTQPVQGTLDFDSLGQFTYTPALDYVGAQRFTYTTCFLSACETAEVIVYIGEMVPENTETYRLVTGKDVPLVINYEIPLDGYGFAIQAEPSNGDLNLYSGSQSISIICSTVEGFDLLVYEPPAGFTGSDYFEVIYCIDGGECHLVKVDVEVQVTEYMPCPCVDHCVWPGDADGSGRVDMNDLLSIGWQLGYTGPDRDYPDNTAWMGQTGDDWAGSLWDMNSKYADSNGDGVITQADTAAISDYYLRAHTLIPQITGLKADYAFEIVPVTLEVDSGDLAVFEIVIGTENYPVVDMHGMSFSLNLPENLIDLSTVNVDFYNESWLGHDAPSLELQKQPSGGRLDAAFSRTTGKPASGVGTIAILTFIVTDDIDGIKTPDGRVPLRIGINGVSSMASNGMLYDVPANEALIYLNPNAKDEATDVEDHVFVFPNPSSGDMLNVYANGDRTLKQIEILDLSGTLLGVYDDITTKHFSPNIRSLQNGLYILRITTTDGVVARKFEILR